MPGEFGERSCFLFISVRSWLARSCQSLRDEGAWADEQAPASPDTDTHTNVPAHSGGS